MDTSVKIQFNGYDPSYHEAGASAWANARASPGASAKAVAKACVRAGASAGAVAGAGEVPVLWSVTRPVSVLVPALALTLVTALALT